MKFYIFLFIFSVSFVCNTFAQTSRWGQRDDSSYYNRKQKKKNSKRSSSSTARNPQKTAPAQVTPPKFKGGDAGLQAYQLKHFKNPMLTTDGTRQNLEGKIVVACIIGTSGKVDEAQVVRRLETALDVEALRVVKNMKFSPARQGKKKIKYRYDITFPIRKGRLSFLELNTIDV